jgi:hypothetical protein
MPQIARARIGCAAVVISKITTGDHPKRTNRRQRPRLRAAQRVLAIAISHDLALQTARQVQTACERLTWIDRAARRIALAIRPAGVITGILAVLVGIRLARITWAAAECSPGVVITIA